MAQEFDQIISILTDMQTTNNSYAHSFDRLLNGINTKLDNADNSSVMSFINAFVKELKRSMDDKYSVTVSKFEDLQSALKAIYAAQNEQVKNFEMRELFDIFTKNVNNFYTEAKQEKAILNTIEGRLAELINNKSDKEDIVRTISLLRKDFENLNNGYRSIIDDINTNLKSIISTLVRMDPLKANDNVRTQVDIIYNSINGIVLKLQDLENNNNRITHILNGVATSEDLKMTNGMIDSLIEKTNLIEDKVNNLADKKDFGDMKKSSDKLFSKMSNLVSKKDFSSLNTQTEELLLQTQELKLSLAKMAKDMEQYPDTKILEESLKGLYSRIEQLDENIESSNIKGDIFDINFALSSLKDELIIIKNIMSDMSDVLLAKITKAIESISFEPEAQSIKTGIASMLSYLPQKEDIEKLFSENKNVMKSIAQKTDSIAEAIAALPTSIDLNKLAQHNPALKSKLEELVQEQKNNSEKVFSKFDKEFSNLYDKTSSLEKWLEGSDLKEKADDILSKLDNKPDRDEILEILEYAQQIVNTLDILSESTTLEAIKHNINLIDENISGIKNVLLTSYDNANVQIIDKLSSLEASVSLSVTAENFNDFVSELKDCIAQIVINLSSSSEKLANLKSEISDSLAKLDFSNVIEILNQQYEFLHNNLQFVSTTSETITKKTQDIESSLMSISEYIQGNFPQNIDYIKEQLSSIKEYLNESKIAYQEAATTPNIDKNFEIGKYVEEVKALIEQNKPNYDISEIENRLQSIEDTISNFSSYNDEFFDNIIQKIDKFEQNYSQIHSKNVLSDESLKEFENLKNLLTKLEEIFKSEIKEITSSEDGTTSDQYQKNISDFISLKLKELYIGLDSLSSESENRLKQGFAYNCELLEEKTSIILDFIRSIKLPEIDNSKIEEGILKLNGGLFEFKNELQQINAGISQYITKQSSDLLEEFSYIKQQIQDLDLVKHFTNIKENLSTLQEFVSENSNKNTQYLYEKISGLILKTESEMKDVIIGDTDALIIKMDNLREYIENALEAIAPPDPEQMRELYDFSKNIEKFKQEQFDLVSHLADKISENIAVSNEEIKSMIAVAMNHDEILSAIDDLKISFKSKLQKLSYPEGAEISELSQGFDDSEYTEVLKELKSDYRNFVHIINNLSERNSEIELVLAQINDKVDTLAFNSGLQSDIIEINEEFEQEKENESQGQNEILNQAPNFDFDFAFDLLKSDIEQLTNSINKLLENKNSILESSQQMPVKLDFDEDKVIELLSSQVRDIFDSIKENWLGDIKSYLESYNVDSILDSINAKLDILTSINNNDELLDEIALELDKNITSKIETINNKLDIIASNNDSELIYDMSEALDDVDFKITESDARITSMLETLNTAINNATQNGGQAEDFLEVKNLIAQQKEAIDKLEPGTKIDALKKCLDELTLEVSDLMSGGNDQLKGSLKDMKESIMAAVVTIFEQVSFIEESEDIKDFVEERTDEINKNIANITKQLQQITAAGDTSFDEYSYSMQDIETDLAKLRLVLKELQNDKIEFQSSELNEISEKLHSITSSVDLLTQDEIKELKSELSTLKEQTRFLIATSDKSYDVINSGMEDFDRIINSGITQKVDQVRKMLEDCATSDSVIRQSLIYMGEWIDSASESINKISTNSEGIEHISKTISNVEEMFEKNETKLDKFEKQLLEIESLQERFEQQEQRISGLEMNIDRILSAIENIEESNLNRKIDKIEKQIEKLSISIEKLTSYVE